jgi:hypothetical protein
MEHCLIKGRQVAIKADEQGSGELLVECEGLKSKRSQRAAAPTGDRISM